MIIIDTTALLGRCISIDQASSEICLLSLQLIHRIRTKLLANWEQNMFKVSKLSVKKGCLC